MIRKYIGLLLLAVALASVPLVAQSQGDTPISGQSKIFGNVDIVAGVAVPLPGSGYGHSTPTITISRSSGIYFTGWVLSCTTAQQPTDVTVQFLGAYNRDLGTRPTVTLRTVDTMVVRMRLRRPDVTAYMGRYCNLTSDAWGYLIVPNVELPLGLNAISISWVDPTIGVAINVQQVNVNVVD